MSVAKDTARPNTTDLPVIETNNRQLRDKRNDMMQAMAASNNPPRLFHGDSGLVIIGDSKPDHENQVSPVLRKASVPVIQNLLADAATWQSTSWRKDSAGVPRKTTLNVSPPRDMADNYLSQASWPGVPPIDGIVTAPMFAANGTLCATSGYHASSRLFVSLPPDFQLIDTSPTRENVSHAKEVIDGLFREVAFSDAASACHARALMILPFVRPMINGPTPLHLIDAPTQSSGKSVAAKICISPFGTPSASSMKGDEEEWRKAILSALLSGRSHIWLDNVKGQLNSPMLAAALTEPMLTERAMGGLGEVSVRIRCAWVATSNNAQLDSDTASRSVVIRLDTGLENPEDRKYKSDPLAHIRTNRAVVVSAILTLIRNWQQQKCPLYRGDHQSRFNHWQSIIGGILQANEIGGFLENLQEFRAALDPEKAAWTVFCQLWFEKFNTAFCGAGDLRETALQIPELAGQLGDKEGKNQSVRLGRLLLHRRDKVFGNFKIRSGPPSRNGATYRVVPKDSPEAKQSVPAVQHTLGGLDS